MDGLLAQLEDSHFGLYKNQDNNNKESAQAKRRNATLDRIKNRRQDEIDRSRNIMGQFDDVDAENEMDVENSGRAYQRQKQRQIRHPKMIGQLMKNDWILNKPDDLDDWMFVPCPKGRQSLLVSVNGSTRLYSNAGWRRLKCETILPSGNRKSQSKAATILDVIIDFDRHTIWVIDMMRWKGYEYLDSDANFRHTWKEMKISELDDQKKFKYKVKSLRAFSTLESSEAKDYYKFCPFNIDGILCYHKDGLYYPSGPEQETYPLYGWTKPDKMEEILGFHCDFHTDTESESSEGDDPKSAKAPTENAMNTTSPDKIVSPPTAETTT